MLSRLSNTTFYQLILLNHLFEQFKLFYNNTMTKYQSDLRGILLFYHHPLLLYLKNLPPTIPTFLPIPKIHKNPVTSRLIVQASNTFTTGVSKLVNKCLRQIYIIFTKVNLPNYTIATSTDAVIARIFNIQKTNWCTSPQLLHHTTFDFESLYTNL